MLPRTVLTEIAGVTDGLWPVTQIHIFWRTTFGPFGGQSIAIVQLAMRSGRIRVSYDILAVIIPVV